MEGNRGALWVYENRRRDGIGSGSAHRVSRSLSPRDITELYRIHNMIHDTPYLCFITTSLMVRAGAEFNNVKPQRSTFEFSKPEGNS